MVTLIVSRARITRGIYESLRLTNVAVQSYFVYFKVCILCILGCLLFCVLRL